jgi:hypothetical protein
MAGPLVGSIFVKTWIIQVDPRMQTSFGDSMYNNHIIFFLFSYGTLFLSKGREVFNGVIGCNFHFLFAALSNTRANFPHM